jgi:hypothetical protein
MIATALRPSKAGSYFKLFALEMKRERAALVVTLLFLRCLELGERLLQNCDVSFKVRPLVRVRSNDFKPDERCLKKCGPTLDQLK